MAAPRRAAACSGLLAQLARARCSTSSQVAWHSAQLQPLRDGGRALLATPCRSLATGAVAAGAAGRPRSLPRRLRALLRDYKQLSKFRLSALVALTASAGFAAGSGEQLDLARLAWTSLGTLSAAACANSLNQLYEVANDARMTRTAARPLPGGRLGAVHAGVFALATGAAGLWILATKANELTAGLGAANILLYAGIYTPLKQLSVANTWVGAVVGAIPPLMGWASAAGQLEPGAWVLAAALFSWQMPHFLALAWMCKNDYVRGGFHMLPGIDPSGRRTAAVALRHCAALLPLGAVAAWLGVTSSWFAGEAALLAAAMGAGALSFRANPTAAGARKLFKGSLLYLPLLLAGLALHRQPNQHAVSWASLRADAQAASAAADRSSVALALPEQLRPGALWASLEAIHWPRLRPLEERWAMLLEVKRELESIRCPSRACADARLPAEAAADAAQQQQQQQQHLRAQQPAAAGAGSRSR